MLRILSTLIIIFSFFVSASAQDSSVSNTTRKDSLKQTHSDSVKYDSILKKSEALIKRLQIDSVVAPQTDTANKTVAFTDSIHPAIIAVKKDSAVKSITKKVTLIRQPKMIGYARSSQDSDLIFYVLIFIIFFLAMIKNSFPKYFSSIFSLSFQATFRQTQTRDQMSQNFFPAFMLNVLFILSGGLFITLVAVFYKWTAIPFWQLFIYSTTILGIIYSVKYFVILFTGWVFNASDSAAEYGFIVFLINKLIGVLFIPILFVIAYSTDEIKKIVITVALCIAVLLLALRYLVSLARIRRNLNLTALHFFIYLCAVEIMPLLIIYKLLFIKTGNT